MTEKVLITGGAGFIGSHLCDELLSAGYMVRVLDNLCEQVHGKTDHPPAYLSKEVEFIKGDVRDLDTVNRALENVSAVFHLAAAVGVGQSMYEIRHYTSVNNEGTATLLEAIIENPVRKLVVASSMSIYGEGLYEDGLKELKTSTTRSPEQLKHGQWDLLDQNGQLLKPLPTPEHKDKDINSIYALNKYDQELMCLITGRAYNIDSTALRFFNVYGPRQALSNPYTGVLAIFASRYLNNKPPIIYEDGLQRRDFVSVYDVVRACRLTLESPNSRNLAINIGSGQSYTVKRIAGEMARVLSKDNIVPEITGKYRVGDIRHCFSDISLAQDVLGFRPVISLQEGLEDLACWLKDQIAADQAEQAHTELDRRGLTYELQHRQ